MYPPDKETEWILPALLAGQYPFYHTVLHLEAAHGARYFLSRFTWMVVMSLILSWPSPMTYKVQIPRYPGL